MINRINVKEIFEQTPQVKEQLWNGDLWSKREIKFLNFKNSKFSLLLVVPTVLVLLSVVLLANKGPYYASFNSDPEYPYLLNSLLILEFETPLHTDHPGTTLQVFSAFIIFGKWSLGYLFGADVALTEAVLKNPESYLRTINYCLLLLIFTALFLAGSKIYSECNKLIPAVTFQLSMLLFVANPLFMAGVKPEPLLVFAGLALTIALIPIIFTDRKPDQHILFNKNRPILIGVILGFGVATKVTFLPLLAVVFLFNKLKEKILILTTSLLAFLFFTLPILSEYPRMIEWLYNLLTHTGKYGSGKQGLPDFSVVIGNIKILFRDEPFLFILLIFYLVIILFLIYECQNRKTLSTRVRNLLLVGCLIIIAQIIITAKHPNTRYLQPAIIICCLLNATVVYFFNLDLNQFWGRIIVLAGVLIIVIGISYNFMRINDLIKRYQSESLVENKIIDKIKAMQGELGCWVFQYKSASSIAGSLYYGNVYAKQRYRNELSHLFPTALFFNVLGNQFESFKYQFSQAYLKRLIDNNRCLLLYGRPFTGEYAQYQGNLILEPIILNRKQALYKITGFR